MLPSGTERGGSLLSTHELLCRVSDEPSSEERMSVTRVDMIILHHPPPFIPEYRHDVLSSDYFLQALLKIVSVHANRHYKA